MVVVGAPVVALEIFMLEEAAMVPVVVAVSTAVTGAGAAAVTIPVQC